MSIQTTAIQHTAAAQKAGYAKGQLVHRDGVVWKSLIANNPYPPGEHQSWVLVG